MRWRALSVAGALLVSFAATPAAVDAQSRCPRFGAVAVAGRVKSDRLTEISGLVASRAHPGVYWTHNDSGGKAEVLALTLDGSDLGSYALPGASATDWEDIAIGPKRGAAGSFLYVGDIGDNAQRRDQVTVYRAAEPSQAPNGAPRALTRIERITLSYPGSPRNAEAILVDPVSGDLVIITKAVAAEARVMVARAASLANGASVTLTDAGRAPAPFVTGADISPDGSLILVRTYGDVVAFPRAVGQSVAAALRAGPCPAPAAQESQGESIAIGADASRYVTISEGRNQPINFVPILGVAAVPTTVPTTVVPVEPDDGNSRTGVVLLAGGVIAIVVVVALRRRRSASADPE